MLLDFGETKMIKCPVCGSGDCTVIGKDLFVEDTEYLRCLNCKTAYVAKSLSELSELYDTYHGTEDFMSEKYFDNETRYVLRLSPWYLKRLGRFKESGKLLDIGCGRGELIYIAGQAGNWQCVGLEVSKEAAEYAKKHFGLDLIVSELKPEIFGDEKFDVIYMRHLVEHLENPHQFLAQVKKVCAPGAVLAVHVPNDFSWTNSFKRCCYRFGISKDFGSLRFPYHLVGYNPKSLRLLFELAGFKHLETRTYSKLNPHFDFYIRLVDIGLTPFSILDTLPSKGHIIVSYFKFEMQDR